LATDSGPLGRWLAIKPPKNKARTNPEDPAGYGAPEVEHH